METETSEKADIMEIPTIQTNSDDVSVPDGAIMCPASIHEGGVQPPTMEVMPVLASDGKKYVNWQEACINPAVKWYYPANHPKSLKKSDD